MLAIVWLFDCLIDAGSELLQHLGRAASPFAAARGKLLAMQDLHGIRRALADGQRALRSPDVNSNRYVHNLIPNFFNQIIFGLNYSRETLF